MEDLGIIWILFLLAIAAFVVTVYCRIAYKAGYPWWLGLLMFIPFINFLLIVFFAFSEWPVIAELKQAKDRLRGGEAPNPKDIVK